MNLAGFRIEPREIEIHYVNGLIVRFELTSSKLIIRIIGSNANILMSIYERDNIAYYLRGGALDWAICKRRSEFIVRRYFQIQAPSKYHPNSIKIDTVN